MSEKNVYEIQCSDGSFESTAMALFGIDDFVIESGKCPPTKAIAIAVGVPEDAVEETSSDSYVALLIAHEIVDQWVTEREKYRAQGISKEGMKRLVDILEKAIERK